jgi:hypothetical protein
MENCIRDGTHSRGPGGRGTGRTATGGDGRVGGLEVLPRPLDPRSWPTLPSAETDRPMMAALLVFDAEPSP